MSLGRLRTGQAGYYALLGPYLAGALLLVCIPALLALAMAFFRYDAINPPAWVGLGNFREINAEPLFWVSVSNSLYFMLLAVPLRLLGALLLALLLKQPGRFAALYRAAVYLPTVIPDVAYALVWLWILNPLYGPLNGLLRLVGLAGPAWLMDPVAAKPALVLMACFQIGEGFVVLLAGLRGIPQEYYEAARVDGGSRMQVFWQITLPLLAPWLMLLSVRDLIMSLQNTFNPAYIMTGGGPYYATLFLPLEMFEEAFDRLRFGTGAAMMLVLLLATLALLSFLFWFFDGWGYDD
jgi:multiple sugar transport system permease protein